MKTATLSIIFLCTVITAYSQNWYKGNLHTHSLWSDGDDYPEMIIDWYKSNGYQFLALSDHNVLAEGKRWFKVPQDSISQKAFNAYLQRFGKKWVEYKKDSGRVEVRLKTFKHYASKFTGKNFIMIPSEEITDKFEKKPIHLNATNVREVIRPQGGASVAEVLQRNIDAVLKQRESTKRAMFPHVNHPNFFYAITAQDMISLRGERFFEVYNGHPLVHNYGDSTHIGIEAMWDLINIEYAKRGQPLLLGLATDDSHNYHRQGLKFSNSGRGWVMVNAKDLTAKSLIESLEAGKFYASSGVTLKSIDFQNDVLRIDILSEPGVEYSTEFIEAFPDGSLKKHTLPGVTSFFRKDPQALYLRAKVVSSRKKTNPYVEGEPEAAWTQPVGDKQ